jgi:CheY-like chemotaxis protein
MRVSQFDPQRTETALSSIERSAKVQTKLISDLLDVSRITAGKLRLETQTVFLADVVAAAVETVQPAALAKSIRLATVCDKSESAVHGDPERLGQIIWNLLSNAIKFTPAHGTVEIGLTECGGQVRLTVTDSGEGIDPSLLPFVFDRFCQAGDAHRKGGLGLGLAIVKELVELHGGSVTAASEGVGKGARFTVVLPSLPVPALKPDQPATPNSRIGVQHSKRLLSGTRVLLVDDDRDAAATIRSVLEQHGARVLTAHSAREAREMLHIERPNVVLSDLGMPEEDGYEFIRRMRAQGAQALHVPAVALSAHSRPGIAIERWKPASRSTSGSPSSHELWSECCAI